MFVYTKLFLELDTCFPIAVTVCKKTGMSFIGSSGASSPDPLAISQIGSSPSKSNDRKGTTPRKILGLTSGNQLSRDIGFAAPFLPNVDGVSYTRDVENIQHDSSPWRVRVTVQAQPDHPRVDSSVPQCSPSKIFAERTYTTTVPLRGGDEPSPVRRKTKGTPKKTRNTPKRRQSTPKSPVWSQSNDIDVPSMADSNKSPLPAKRGRGRPRKSMEASCATQLPGESETGRSSQQEASTRSKRRQTLSASVTDHSVGNAGRAEEALEFAEHNEFLDSIMESEGFSMVSVSSLPSAQASSGIRANANMSSGGGVPSFSKRHVTPSLTDGSPVPPPPPKPGPAPQFGRELDQPSNGTPKLARVVRAGIALQGVLSPENQRRATDTATSRLNSSSPLLSAASPKDRMDELFNGFGPGTRRELRAGLRLGEELARRQGLGNGSAVQHQPTNEDVFGPNPEISYPQLPDSATSSKYSLKVPGPSFVKSPSTVNQQLPSPADSEADTEDDRMSWKYDTLPRGAVTVSPMPKASPNAGEVGVEESHAHQTTMDSMALWHQEQEGRCRQERNAISKQIEEAHASQVIIINSDDESGPDAEVSDECEDNGDIWQEEAQNSGTGHSTSDIPPIFLQSDTKKPRRSQLPSPWMRKSQDVLNSSVVPNESDLFWQPTQAQAASRMAESHIQNNGVGTQYTGRRSSSILETARKSDSGLETAHMESSLQNSLTATPSEAKAKFIQPAGANQRETILDQTFADSEPEDTTYQNNESMDSLDSEDEDMASTFLKSLSVQDDSLDKDTEIDIRDSEITTASSPAAQWEEVPQPQTPLPPPSLQKAKTPKSKTPKHVRFSTELSRPEPDKLSAPQPAPLPPAPASWLSR
ncbi:MAG: hypothetical protein Q9218_005834, partial [Villophora microphyllina]